MTYIFPKFRRKLLFLLENIGNESGFKPKMNLNNKPKPKMKNDTLLD